MLSTFLSLLLFALAGAVSTVPVTITILILLSPGASRGALPFLLGSLAGAIVVVGLSAVGLHLLPLRPHLPTEQLAAQLGIVIGAVLVGYAVRLLTGRRRGEGGLAGKMTARFHSARPWEFAALGLGLNLRPKAILLAVTAGALIGLRELPLLPGSLLVVAYAAVAQTAVLVPIAVWLRSPVRANNLLTALYAWLQRNGRRIAGAVTLVLGLVILVRGVLSL